MTAKNHNMKKESVKLDEIIKSLFAVSNEVLIQLMNSLFHEDYDSQAIDITIGNNERLEEVRSRTKTLYNPAVAKKREIEIEKLKGEECENK